jgi:DNA transformation protein
MAGMQALLEELLAPIGGVVIKRMFGGLGILHDGMMFALVSKDVLYFKADATTVPRFQAEDCGRWVYPGRNRNVEMPYWRAPERLLDEPDEFVEWARAAVAAAERVRASKPRSAVPDKGAPRRKTPVAKTGVKAAKKTAKR